MVNIFFLDFQTFWFCQTCENYFLFRNLFTWLYHVSNFQFQLNMHYTCLYIKKLLDDNYCSEFKHSLLSSHSSPSALWELSALNGSYGLFISFPAELCLFPGQLSLKCCSKSHRFLWHVNETEVLSYFRLG